MIIVNAEMRKYILITSSNFPQGGPGANYLNLFCRGLKANGAEISVYLLKGFAFGNAAYHGPAKGSTTQGIPFHYLGFRQRPNFLVLKLADQLKSFLNLLILLSGLVVNRKTSTILLYNSDVFFNFPIHLTAKTFGIRIIKFVAEIIDKSQYRKSLIGRMSRTAYMINFRHLNIMSDDLIVFSHYLCNKFTEMGFKEGRILIQPNLTDFEYWKVDPIDIKYCVGYSGAPYMKDGLNDLLKAISILNARGHNVSLLIVGDATFGKSLIPSLKMECKRLGVEDLVSFTGLVSSDEVKRYLSQCSVLAITRPDTAQTKAGFPTKLGEYMALGKPVLATKFGDIEKYFKDKDNIILAECDDPGSIADKLEWMICNTIETRNIALNGHKVAELLLEYNISMKRILQFITKVNQ